MANMQSAGTGYARKKIGQGTVRKTGNVGKTLNALGAPGRAVQKGIKKIGKKF